MSYQIELRHLKYFQTLSNELNFRKASEKLFISQPGLSRQIKQMEEIYSRELIYTAVTRAKHSVTIFSSKTNLEKTILNQLERNTGLQIMLQSPI